MRNQQISFRKGSGETLAFLPSMIGMLMILFYIVAAVQFFSCADSLMTSLETVGRAVAVCSSLDRAEEQAQRVAESIVNHNGVNDIQTEVSLTDSGTNWDAGASVLVTLSAHVDTLEPFFLSRRISKKILVTVEYSDRNASENNLHGDTYSEKIFDYFESKGFSKESAAAIVGNCFGESGCNPESEGMGGCGIAAFTPASRLKNQAALEGKDWKNLSFQLDFLLRDISSHWYGEASTQTAAFINAGIVEAGVTLNDFKKLKDVKYATDVFCAYYEQCYVHNARLDVREEAAEAAYRLYV
ncbi:MAG: phage tail tip lysozyme [Lachnospiraceae bacterium]|nr:phage tail tip lysozyme [Lachnospiraceae bacterium]